MLNQSVSFDLINKWTHQPMNGIYILIYITIISRKSDNVSIELYSITDYNNIYIIVNRYITMDNYCING